MDSERGLRKVHRKRVWERHQEKERGNETTKSQRREIEREIKRTRLSGRNIEEEIHGRSVK